MLINAIRLFEIIGEWWKADTEAVVNQAMQTGLPPNVSDAHTINGHSGPVPNCSTAGTSICYIYVLYGHLGSFST